MIRHARIIRGRLWETRLKSLWRASTPAAALLTCGAIIALLEIATPAIAGSTCGGSRERDTRSNGSSPPTTREIWRQRSRTIQSM